MKLKICEGWDENPHPSFIWKKINGKLYCKNCSLKVEKLSDKNLQKTKEKTEITIKLHKLFKDLWDKLPENKFCTICNTKIYGENLSIYWDHLLEKSKYPELMFDIKNIVFLCADCHNCKTMGNPKQKHKELIEQAKKILLNVK